MLSDSYELRNATKELEMCDVCLLNAKVIQKVQWQGIAEQCNRGNGDVGCMFIGCYDDPEGSVTRMSLCIYGGKG